MFRLFWVLSGELVEYRAMKKWVVIKFAGLSRWGARAKGSSASCSGLFFSISVRVKRGGEHALYVLLATEYYWYDLDYWSITLEYVCLSTPLFRFASPGFPMLNKLPSTLELLAS